MARVLIMPLISLCFVTMSASDYTKYNDKMVTKYLGGISDNEINNFE
jgi:hypothetical protein